MNLLPKTQAFLRALGLVLMMVFACPAHATPPAAPSSQTLATEFSARMDRVPEFVFLRQEAEKLGVKVYLFGGTAASYAHYVKQDLQREAGDSRYPPHLYDYDYTNIFRSTQDLDVVVDGSVEQAEKLEAVLKQKYPHFIGDKGAKWEVRPLRVARADKEAILNNPNFSNQHTDSHSTGMVEVTKSPGELSVKDVRDWQSATPKFLEDVRESKIHYYHSPLHSTTARAKQGLNPEILSAIRYLTKAFQYDLEMRPEDRTKIQEIVRKFDPASLKNSYVLDWIEKNGKKLFQHSVDLERAWNDLEKIGLRQKLIALKNNSEKIDSLSWWMNKKPLPTTPLGHEPGLRAAEIAKTISPDFLSADGKILLAHETNNFLAFESITRDKNGELNALISRENTVGEAAVHGNGFYTRLGKQGARNTGFTIRMKLDPAAVEGVDFERHGEYFVLKNKAAVSVISEEINMSLVGYFHQLASGNGTNSDNKALIEKFIRKAGGGTNTGEELKEAFAFVRKNLNNSGMSVDHPMVTEWLKVQKRNPAYSFSFGDYYALLKKKPLSYDGGDELLAAAFKSFALEKDALTMQEAWSLVEDALNRSRNSANNSYAKKIIQAWFDLPQAQTQQNFINELDKSLLQILAEGDPKEFNRTSELLNFFSHQKHALGTLGEKRIRMITELAKHAKEPTAKNARDFLINYVFAPGSKAVFEKYPESLRLILDDATSAKLLLAKHIQLVNAHPAWRGVEVDKAWFTGKEGTQLILDNMKSLATESRDLDKLYRYFGDEIWAKSPEATKIFHELKNTVLAVGSDHSNLLYNTKETAWVNQPAFHQVISEALSSPTTEIGIQAVLADPELVKHPNWSSYVRAFVGLDRRYISAGFFGLIMNKKYIHSHADFISLFKEFASRKKNDPEFQTAALRHLMEDENFLNHPSSLTIFREIMQLPFDKNKPSPAYFSQDGIRPYLEKSGYTSTDYSYSSVKEFFAPKPTPSASIHLAPPCDEAFARIR